MITIDPVKLAGMILLCLTLGYFIGTATSK
jgi:hypothetical protein